MVKYTEDTMDNDWKKIVTGLVEKFGLVWHSVYHGYYGATAHDKIFIGHEKGSWPFNDKHTIAMFTWEGDIVAWRGKKPDIVLKVFRLAALDIYGREYVDILTKLSEEIEQETSAVVRAVLKSEYTRTR